MRDMSLIMREAHKLTKEIKAEFPKVDYKMQLGLCISYLLEEKQSIKKDILTLVRDAMEVAKEELGADYIKSNIWEKYGKKREYFQLIWYKNNGEVRKVTKCGFVDLINMEYSTKDYYTVNYNVLTKQKDC